MLNDTVQGVWLGSQIRDIERQGSLEKVKNSKKSNVSEFKNSYALF